jgi:hypothetical protein
VNNRLNIYFGGIPDFKSTCFDNLADMQDREEREINAPYRQEMNRESNQYEDNADYINELTGIQGNQIDRGRALDGMYNTGPNVAAMSNLIQQKANNNSQFTNSLIDLLKQNAGFDSEAEDAKQEVRAGWAKKELAGTMGDDYDFSKAYPKKKYPFKDLLNGNFLDSLRNKNARAEKESYNFGSR